MRETALAVALFAAFPVTALSAESCTETCTETCTGDKCRDTGELTLSLGGEVSLKLVPIPAGQITLGIPDAERRRAGGLPRVEATIDEGLFMGRCEVTRRQFARFVADACYKTDAEKLGRGYGWNGEIWDEFDDVDWRHPGFEQTDDHPVTCVSWNDAVAFCEWLGKKTGKQVRLPREAEWEHACRAGTTTKYAWGDNPHEGKGWCNVADLTAKKTFDNWEVFKFEDGYLFTAPVGTYRANAWGLHDMHGNVWEWCQDKHILVESDEPFDDRYPSGDTLRNLRGGSWLSSTARCRSGLRAGCPPLGWHCDFITGFRVVISKPWQPVEEEGETP